MATVGIRALKQNASAVVAAAASGESITITDRGRPAALLTPIPSTRLQTLVNEGKARPPKTPGSLADLPEPVRIDGVDISGDLAAMRLSERF